MIYWAKGIAIKRPLVIWQQGVGVGGVFYSPMIGFESFSEPVSHLMTHLDHLSLH